MLVEGIAHWAYVTTLDKKYKKWRVKLYVDKKNMLLLKANGVSCDIDTDDEGNVKFYKNFQRYLMNKKTNSENPAPDCVDAALEPYRGAIGNGSRVLVKYIPFKWDNKHGSGTSVDLDGVQVLDLVLPDIEHDGDVSSIVDDGVGFTKVGEGIKAVDQKVEQIQRTKEKEAEILSDEDF